MSWDRDPHVLSPVARTLPELLEEGPRRQELPGFEPVYRDFVDYIIRCTHRIWEQKNPGLCRTHYSPDCMIHTLAGPVQGVERVVQNTIDTLGAFSDRVLIGEDVIWSEDAQGTFYSSHRIMSRMTHMGDDPLFGPATLKTFGTMTIADCLCRDNLIVEEWLVRDNMRALLQLGGDPVATALRLAEADREGDQARHGWRTAAIERLRGTESVAAEGHPAKPLVRMLDVAFRGDRAGEAAALLSPAAELHWPSGRLGYGRGYWIGCVTQLRSMLHEPAFAVEHVAARPLPRGATAVALRWSLAGTHRGHGPWGPPTGREILVMAVSHYRLRADQVVEDFTVFDELAVLRQAMGGLGA